MKKALSISFVYIGLVIGAGFASGREIFEYFNLPSQQDFTGIILASLCFGILSYIIMSLSKSMKTKTFDSFLEEAAPKSFPLVKAFMYAFMFCGFFVMLAASGTLFQDTLSMPFGFGVVLLALFCFSVFAFDLKGIVVINSVLVPLMIAGMTALCISSILTGIPTFSTVAELRNNSVISALCYVSYNTITAGAVLVPLSAQHSKKTIITSVLFSGAVLGLLIFIVWLALNTYYNTILDAEMPLLTLAAIHGKTIKLLYASVLFMALCTTAISHGFGVLSKFRFQQTSDRIIAAALFCLVAMPFAKLGFSTLISRLYSIFGYIGLLWTVFIVYKYMKTN